MKLQLVLIDDSERDWRINDRTLQVGRQGIQAARAALHSAPRRNPVEVGHPASSTTIAA